MIGGLFDGGSGRGTAYGNPVAEAIEQMDMGMIFSDNGADRARDGRALCFENI